MAFALPRFLGAADAQPARPVLMALRDGRQLPSRILDRGVMALERSTRWAGTPAHVLSDLALLKLLRSQRDQAGADTTGEAGQFLKDALQAQETSLRQSPSGSNGWGRLAYAHYVDAGLTPAARAALEMSLRTGGLDLPLLSFRLQMILGEWDALGAELRASAPGEVIRFARHGRLGFDALVDIYLVSPHAEIIDAALSESPAHQSDFVQSLARRVGGP